MKKIVVAILLAGIVFLFGGCGKPAEPVDNSDIVEDTNNSQESEQTTAEKEAEETTVEQTDSKSDEVVVLSSFIGKTVKEITDMYGTDYEVNGYNGGYFISYADQPFSLFYRDPASPDGIRSDKPAPTDEIFIVMSGGEGLAIVDGVNIGSRAAELRLYLGEKLDIQYDEMNEEYFSTFTKDGLRYVVYIDEESLIMTSCEIWDDSL